MKTKKRETAQAGPKEAPLSLPHFGPGMKLLLYPISLLQPASGLTLGFLYLRQQEPGARSFGRNCLILALIGLLLRAMRPQAWDGAQSTESLLQPFY